MTTRIKPAVWFWILSVILLLWNLIGLTAFLTEAFAPELVTQAYDEKQMELYNARPGWYLFNFGLAVFTGTLSCVLLLARRKFAVTLAVVSLVSIMISSVYTYSSGELDAVGMSEQTLFYMVLLMDVVLVLFAVHASRKRWIV
ncbi:hypothetical protein [Nonlabens ponticola]|uniref:Sugar transporter n=1 Tax=Nonlabens ponticola TaxID=2496866 RepID=A0A3S9MV56_9FLAO|nr:hypothetical protein [Nonlabens ponticola]AZQ43057.1 hypothetical protein EJ995_01970 [Nonlabens ponticola]